LGTYEIIPLIEIVFCVALLGLLIARGRHHVARKSFGLFLIFMALWGLFIFLMRFTPDLSLAALWETFVFGSILSAALAFYWFTMNFTGSRLNKKIFLPMVVALVLVLSLIPTGLIFRGMQLMWYGKAPIIGPLFPLYVLCVYLPLVFSMLALLKNARRSRNNDERTRHQYIVVAIIAMFVGGTTDYLPAIGLNLYPLGIMGNILFCILATIAMLRYGLLEIRVVLRKGAAYSLISILILGTFGSIILFLTIVFQNTVNPLSLTLTITAVFLIAAIFQPLLLKLQGVVDRWFFQQRYDYLQALKRFADDQDADLDLSQLSASLVTTVANSMQSSGAYLLLPSPVTRDFVTVAFSGKISQRDITLAASAPLAVTLKYHDGIVDSNDMEIIPALNSLGENDRRPLEDNNIELIMALKKDTQLTGILLIGGKISREPYSNEDKHLLQAVSGDIAAKIDNANRFDNIKKAHSELQRTMDGVISAISAVVESRDPYTAGHQRRVAELARAIAVEMGLTEWQRKGMHIIGLLHDVGKIAVPAEILSKPGKISQYEFNIIKNHSRIGFEILEKVDFPWPVARAILQHHERLNGSGYPEGIAGGEIILEAKILSVADVVEAMSSHRPYRPALGLEKALEEIKQHSGILYDREAVEACLKLLNNRQFAFDELMSAAESPRESAMQGVCAK
jgi:putative nucleotidyltransferase with HDIG domain